MVKGGKGGVNAGNGRGGGKKRVGRNGQVGLHQRQLEGCRKTGTTSCERQKGLWGQTTTHLKLDYANDREGRDRHWTKKNWCLVEIGKGGVKPKKSGKRLVEIKTKKSGGKNLTREARPGDTCVILRKKRKEKKVEGKRVMD